MCACAGSSTERVHLLRTSGTVRIARLSIFKHLAGQVRMDLEPGRIGFMSTQRRENRWQRTSCTERADTWKQACLLPVAQQSRARANGGTAPPAVSAWLATNSLQLDHRIGQLVRQSHRRGSPPPGAGSNAATATPATLRSSLPLIPFPSGFARIHPSFPQVPAGDSRWTERYDGKGNLHLQYAA
jgi:hypothetical protein